MKVFVFLLLFITLNFSSYSAVYFAVVDGIWTDVSTWAASPSGPGGAGVPGVGDVAITNGHTIGLDALSGNVTVDRLTVTNTVVNSIYYSDPFFTFIPVTLTINLSLSSTAAPVVQVIEDKASLNIVIAGAGTAVINNWSATSPFNNLTFSSGGSTTINSDLAISSSLTVSSGTTLIIGALNFLTANGASPIITVSSGGTFNVEGAVNGNGSTSSRFNSIVINGDVTVGSNGYINTTNFNLNAGSTLTNSFNGVNQTEGWWYQSIRPSGTVSLNTSSTVYYSSSNDQNVFATTYGNLIISDGGGGATKQLVGAGSLSVLGDALIDGAAIFAGNDNDVNIDGGFLIHGDLTSNNTSTRNLSIGGSFTVNGTVSVLGSPTNVIMDGISAQLIQGSSPVNFSDLTISNTSASVSPNNQDIIISGMLDVDASATFNPNGRQVNLAGNLIIDGAITASGTFEFDGTTNVSGIGTSAFNNVIITNTLSAPSQTATIAGDFTNNGTFSNVNGTVTFNGSNAQNISGSSTNEFYNLGVTNTGDIVSNNGTTNLNTEMTMSSGASFAADGGGSGTFTIRSTSGTNTARIGDISGASITGNVIAQRYFNGGGDVWRNFGVYVNGATLSDITGSGFTFNGTGNDMAYYDETVSGVVANGWILKSAFGTSNLSTTLGYSMWTRASETPRVVSFNGALNQGTQTMPLTYTANAGAADDGWHLINNPFPSAIDWNNVTRNASVNAVIAIWDTSVGNYDYSSSNIASGQAFWVQTNASGPTLSIPESAKISGSATFLRSSEEEITDQLIVSLSRNDTIDRTYIRFMEGATDQFDTEYDGRKLSNDIFNLGSLSSDGDELAVNRMSVTSNCQKDINLLLYDDFWDNIKKEYYRGFVPGNYELSFNGLESFTTSLDFVLIDYNNGTSTSTPINENSVYSFSVDTTVAESWGANRFVIQLSEKTIDENVVYNSVEHCKLGTEVTFTNTQSGITYAIEKNGELIIEDIANGNDLTLIILDEETIEGINKFDLNLKNGSCSNVLLVDEVIFEISSILEIGSVTDGLSCGLGYVLLKADGAVGNAYYNWYETLDALDPIPNQNSGEYLTPEIDATKFYYVSIINEVGCESSTRSKVIAEIVHVSNPDIQIEGDVISTTAIADSYQWYNGGDPMEGETTESITVKESGIYSVVITTNTCLATSENIIVEILGIKDLEEIGIEIYPNPVIDILKINSSRLKINSILIFDTKGIEIVRLEDAIPNEIDMKSIKKGIYIINIATDNQTITYRVRKK